jgi:very-short-patch-repair endonuclease
MGKLDDALLPVFAAQHWLLAHAQVIEAGGSPTQIERRVELGRWERVDARVYRLAGTPRSWEATVLAPVLSAGPRSMASHLCAAALHGIPGFARATPEISIPRGNRYRREGVRSHESTDLDRCARQPISGVPTTDLPRALLDVGRYVGDRRLHRSIEWARRERGITWSDLIRTLARHARRGRPGIQRLRRVISANAHRAEVTDSDFELLVLALLREHGLPEPVLHFRVLNGTRFVAEIDLAYPNLKIAIELDGSHHLEADVRERDLPRQNDLVLLGWTVLRFTWDRFATHPEAIVGEIRAALRDRLAA